MCTGSAEFREDNNKILRLSGAQTSGIIVSYTDNTNAALIRARKIDVEMLSVCDELPHCLRRFIMKMKMK